MKDFAQKYFDLLNGEYSGINLTRINNFEEFYNKQILDSVLPLDQSEVFNTLIDENEYLVDVGFGGGFPILPLAYRCPNNKFIGIETRRKKADVVREISEKINLNNVTLFHSRIENVLIDFDCIITFKAVGKVYDFLSKINTTAKVTVFFFKGPGFYELEADQIEKSLDQWDIVSEDEILVPGTEKRYLISFQNKNVLRGTKAIKQLVKLSDIK